MLPLPEAFPRNGAIGGVRPKGSSSTFFCATVGAGSSNNFTMRTFLDFRQFLVARAC
jgi:hypothetical protein